MFYYFGESFIGTSFIDENGVFQKSTGLRQFLEMGIIN
jgi:hypothetical protein